MNSDDRIINAEVQGSDDTATDPEGVPDSSCEGEISEQDELTAPDSEYEGESNSVVRIQMLHVTN